MKQQMKKQIALTLISLIAIFNFAACGNNSLTLDSARPNASSNPVRINTGGNTTANTAGNFASCVNLSYYAGNSSGSVLQNICIARNNSDLKQIRLTSTSLNPGQNICVITGAQYDSDTCGYGTYFIDLGEERCGTVDSSGSRIFDMVRSDFNIVTVVRQEDLTAYSNWVNGYTASHLYPAQSVGQISPNLTSPCGN